ncbi:M20 metallopeptidase family protein [Nonomuraea terrae]|uniref:M20 metallopeptidase family protein n=1 Tax=Nonomuraea terrae TaxID=2530383 RepID=UPI001CB7129B|nr:M20 family metallopeptidase [Nonomuraea terrae]
MKVDGRRADAETALRAALHRELPTAIALRRELHAWPRVSGHERPTLERVLGALPGLDAERVAGTGAVVRVGGPGPAVAVRGELDALPMDERTGVPWAATNGAMHSCGHDVHLAAAIALARALARTISEPRATSESRTPPLVTPEPRATSLAGFEPRAGSHAVVGTAPLLVVLQPREETQPSGALDVVGSGVLERHRVQAMIGAHVQPLLPEGTVACTPGAVNASADEFTVTVTGVEGHAAYPHLTRDPVLAMAQVIVAAQHLVSRAADPMVPTVVTFGTVNAGTAPNALPREATAKGTMRTMSPAWRERLHQRFTEVVQDTARAYGCTAEVEIRPGEPVLINDPALTVRTGERLREHGWDVTDELRSCGADDFARYGEVAPSLMMFVGVDTEAGLHSPAFLPGDDSVAAVAEALLAGYLEASSPSRFAADGHPAGHKTHP